MPGPATIHGARAIMKITATDPTTGKSNPIEVGVFNNVSYNVTIDVVPVNVLGSILPVELVQTGQEAVQLNCSGFRVYQNGPYANGKVPKVKDLLTYNGLQLEIQDRVTNQVIMRVINAKCTGYRTTITAKGTADMEVNYMGIVLTDESASTADMVDVGAVKYPIQ